MQGVCFIVGVGVHSFFVAFVPFRSVVATDTRRRDDTAITAAVQWVYTASSTRRSAQAA